MVAAAFCFSVFILMAIDLTLGLMPAGLVAMLCILDGSMKSVPCCQFMSAGCVGKRKIG
jgi:hypothetical protein